MSLNNVNIGDFRDSVKSALNQDVEIVELNDSFHGKTFRLRMKFIDNENDIISALKTIYPDLKLNSVDSFGP